MNNQPIRVAHIVGKWLGGGVESMLMNYYKYIDKNNIQFDFICDNDSTNIPYEEIEKMGGRVILIPPYQKVFKYHKELKRVLSSENYKIVHSHINTLSVFSLYAAKCAGVPVRIAHSHSTIINNNREFKRNVIKNILKYFSKLFATEYFACSDMAAISQFGKKTFNSGKVIVINNAIDIERFKYDESIRMAKRKELNINNNTLVIGHIGRFVETKNHSFLIQIFDEIHKNNQDSKLLLAGQGPLENEIKSKVIEMGLDDAVIFLGQRDDVNELYQVFDIFLLPSLYEGLPVVGVEAQASGLLCFFTNNMTKNAKVIESTEFMSITDSAQTWALKILDAYPFFKRKDTSEQISDCNLNISVESKKLEKIYIDFYNYK